MSQWDPIATAPKGNDEKLVEVLGCCWTKLAGRWVMSKELFITFWSPTLGKFYCSPTHWTPLPDPPRRAPENGDSTPLKTSPEAKT